ncbi:MAG TPA: cell division protein ZapA [Candidatus Cloacimonadota bacterium]|nr:cell division protein ZapA [Candidatus Cloacimonadota bacterium]
MTSIEVAIFGRVYRLRTSDPEATLMVAAELDRQLTELKDRYEIMDFSKLLLLVALQQQEEVQSLKKNYQTQGKELERLNQMVSKILGDL